MLIFNTTEMVKSHFLYIYSTSTNSGKSRDKFSRKIRGSQGGGGTKEDDIEYIFVQLTRHFLPIFCRVREVDGQGWGPGIPLDGRGQTTSIPDNNKIQTLRTDIMKLADSFEDRYIGPNLIQILSSTEINGGLCGKI